LVYGSSPAIAQVSAPDLSGTRREMVSAMGERQVKSLSSVARPTSEVHWVFRLAELKPADRKSVGLPVFWKRLI
jgi:hypothetical protein